MKEIQNSDNVIYFSQISLFEISIKQKIGKLPFFYASRKKFTGKQLTMALRFLTFKTNIFSYNEIPLIKDHRNPFDRLLIAMHQQKKP